MFHPNLSVEMASIGIKETYYVFTLQAKSNESLAKGMGQRRWESNSINLRHWKLGNKTASVCVPDLDLMRPMCKEFLIRWVLRWGMQVTYGMLANMHLIVKADRMKLGSVMIPWIRRWRHDDLGSLVIKEFEAWAGKHQVPEVDISICWSWSLNNTCIQNLWDPANAKLAVTLSHHMRWHI